MTSRERIMAVLLGGMPDRVPVSLYKINPFEKESFWAKHKSFEKLLQAAAELQDTFHIYRPKTGFFFSAPGSIEVKAEDFKDTPLTTTVRLSVKTALGELTRTSRTSNTSIHHWVQKPWIENERDIRKFLALPYIQYQPVLSEYYQLLNDLGDRGIAVIALPDPVGVTGELFAPGDFARFAHNSPSLIKELLEKMHKRLINLYRFISMSVSGAVIRIRGAEYATYPEIPHEYFKDTRKAFLDFVLRYDKELIDILRSGNRNYICYHWHGDIEPLLPYVMKLGIDILEPVVNTFDMPDRITRIRKTTGDKIVLMGGVLSEDMEFRSSSEVRLMVKDAILQGGKNGRFILIPSSIPESSPVSPEMEANYIEFLKAGTEFGKYPLAR
ncbi:MAG TPA: uroporphyrinogen decarboxylase family protein [bacterium]|nr:uroporphyrinogen decarboxylase family protein [bacterium]